MNLLRWLFPQAPSAIEMELTAKLQNGNAGIGLVGVIACVTSVQAAFNHDLVPAALMLMIALVALGRLIKMQQMRLLHGKYPPDLETARRWQLGFGLGSCLTSLLLGITNFYAISYRDPALTLLVACALCCYVFSLILRTAVSPLVCLSSIMLALVPTIVGLLLNLSMVHA